MIVCNKFVHKCACNWALKPYYDSHDNRSSPRTAAQEMGSKFSFINFLHTREKRHRLIYGLFFSFFLPPHILKESCRTSWITVKNYQEFLSTCLRFRRWNWDKRPSNFRSKRWKKKEKMCAKSRSSEWFRLINKHYSILSLLVSVVYWIDGENKRYFCWIFRRRAR